MENSAFLLAKLHVVCYNIQKAILCGQSSTIEIKPNHVNDAIRWMKEKKQSLYEKCELCQNWKAEFQCTDESQEKTLEHYSSYISGIKSFSDISPYTAKQIARGFPWSALSPTFDTDVNWTFCKSVGNIKFTLPIWTCAKIRFLLTFSSPCLAVWYMDSFPDEFWAEEVTDIANDQYAKQLPPISEVIDGSYGTLDFMLPEVCAKKQEKCRALESQLEALFGDENHKDLFYVHLLCARMIGEQHKKKSMFNTEEREVINEIETMLSLCGFNAWLAEAEQITVFTQGDECVKLDTMQPMFLVPENFRCAIGDAFCGVFTWECVLSNMSAHCKFFIVLVSVCILTAFSRRWKQNA